VWAERPPQKKDLFESFKENQIGLILLGIVIGVIIANMRPVVFHAK
jgi:preprotein translocase subunit Sss1